MNEDELIALILQAAKGGQWLMAFSISLSLVVEVFDRLDTYKAKLEASPLFGWAGRLIPPWMAIASLSEAYKKLIVVGLSGLGALTFGIAGGAPWDDVLKLAASSSLYAAGFHSLAIRMFPRGPTPPHLQPVK
jgi:hypothetical protein